MNTTVGSGGDDGRKDDGRKDDRRKDDRRRDDVQRSDGKKTFMTEQHVVPMIHVPDVRATAAWYQSIGFAVVHTFEDQGEMNFALLSYGNSEIMLTGGGHPSDEERREVDLYIRTEDIESLYDLLKDQVEIREGLNNTFYGTREFIIRDPNRFWVTFGQPTSADT